jgi:diguanylate cyclase (GGDEF)-like protein
MAVVIASVTALAIDSLRGHSDDARVTQTTLANVRAEVTEMKSLEWEARATGLVGAELIERRRVLTTRLRGELDTLRRIDGDHAESQVRLRKLVTGYESAVDDMFGFLARGDRERAEEVDERRVDPSYPLMRKELAKHDRKEGAQAVEILRQTTLWTFLSLGGALMTLLALFWRFRRTEHNSIREQTRMLEHETMHDHLTGLPNRRRLMADLDSPGGRRLLVFFDLDGFKSYNDTFGHLEGDLLLERLGHKLARGVGSNGVAYRLGGDEFCVIAPLGMGEDDALVPRCVEALREDGEGFQVRASWGRVLMPDDASTGAAALVLADQRMYADKRAGRASARQQTRDVILRVLAERHPEVREHVSEVAVLARATGQRLGLSSTQLDELERAAELHDIGKIAIPDAILDKPGPLDEEEWRFMHRHTLIGESVLSAAPALASVAKVVRSSHERFDGGGYPDGLADDAIPLASRIVFVCDAFHAMTSERPYGTPMSEETAIAELSRCAGTQFDPEVVIAFSAVQAAPTPPLLIA